MNIYPETSLVFLDVPSATTSAKITPDSGFTVQNVHVMRGTVTGDVVISCGAVDKITFFDTTLDASGIGSFDTIFYCPQAITVTTPGKAWIGITGMMGNRTDGNLPVFLVSTSTIMESTSTPITGTSTTIYAVNGFSYGEIVIASLLLMLVAGQFFGGIMNRVIGIKQKIKNYY